MIIDLLTAVVPGAPLLAAMVLAFRRNANGPTRRLASAATGVAATAALALLVIVPSGGTRSFAGLVWLARPGLAIALLASTIATLVLAFASRALAGDGRGHRFAVLASLLTAATAMLAIAGDLVVLVVAWIAVGQLVVALLAHPGSAANRHAVRVTRRALLVGDGSLVIALALVALGVGRLPLPADAAGSVAGLAAVTIPGVTAIRLLDVVAVLVVVAAISRSALVPFHRWLPTTLAAPTPVSALLHAGVVNGAGVLLLALAPVFGAAPAATALAFASGVVTAIVASTVMLVRTDVKGGLAWSTAGQMGFMVVQFAIGAYGAALFHLIGHGLYKASAFLGAGDAIAIHARARHRPAARSGLSRPVRAAAVVVLPSVGVAAAWSGLALTFGPAKTLLVATVAWLLAAHLLAGWLHAAPFGPAGSLLVALAGTALLAGAYLAALGGFERALGPALPTAGPGVVGPVPLAVVLGLVAASAGLLALLPAAAPMRVRVHALCTGFAVRRSPMPATGVAAAADEVTASAPDAQPRAPHVRSRPATHAPYVLSPEVTR